MEPDWAVFFKAVGAGLLALVAYEMVVVGLPWLRRRLARTWTLTGRR